KYPGQTQGQRIKTAVSLVDIMPTVLDTVGASYPSHWMDGQSLLTAEQQPDRSVFVTRLGGVASIDLSRVAVIRGSMKLVRRGKDELLFDLATDPDEQTNLLKRHPVPELEAELDL